jgi:peptide/nickel transport system permease protein
MVSDGRTYMLNQWWIATYPGLAIFIVVLAFNMLGDMLRDIFDPRQYK